MSREEILALPKIERIRELQRWGLNTPDYQYFDCGDERALEWRTENPQATLRMYFAGDEDKSMGRGPVYIAVKPKNIYAAIKKHYRDWNLMVDENPIHPNNCLFAGNVQLELHSHNGFGVGHMLVVDHESCVVRDIEHSGVALEFNIHGNVYAPNGLICSSLTKVVRTLLRCPYWNELIYEFCVYPFGVGAFDKDIIFWEVRKNR